MRQQNRPRYSAHLLHLWKESFNSPEASWQEEKREEGSALKERRGFMTWCALLESVGDQSNTKLSSH